MARFVPTYWAMRGFLDVILQGSGIADVILPTFALLVFTMVFTLIAAFTFRIEETKVYYA